MEARGQRRLRMLQLYEQELRHLRDGAAEFAAEHPKIAARLDLKATECADPYVERLLEGFAFLTARVQLELECGHARFAQHLLQVVAPNYVAPVPSMGIARFTPSPDEGSLVAGVTVPRHTPLTSPPRKGEQTSVVFRTAHDVTLWPLEVREAQYYPYRRDLADLGFGRFPRAESALRLRLATTASTTFDQLAIERLPLYLHGSEHAPVTLLEQLAGHTIGVAFRPPGRPAPWTIERAGQGVRQLGFDDDEALLPYTRREFAGHRLLHEYFALPERTMFVEIDGLAPAVRRHVGGTELDVFLLFDRRDERMENAVSPSQFVPFCAPIVNLFPRVADRVRLDPKRLDYHVAVDGRLHDFEVYAIDSVTGIGSRADERLEFLPIYRVGLRSGTDAHLNCWYDFERRERAKSAREKERGTRSSYLGSDLFLRIVDPNRREAPYPEYLKQLELRVLCTNRDLPLRIATDPGESHLRLDTGAPVQRIEILRGPTRPALRVPDAELAWRIVSHLSLNYLSIADSDEHESALRELLSLYADLLEEPQRRQVQGIRTVTSRAMHERVPVPGPVTVARGLEIAVTCDESSFEGHSAYALGSVLDRFFARCASINSFTRTVLRSHERGEVMRWPTRIGQRKNV